MKRIKVDGKWYVEYLIKRKNRPSYRKIRYLDKNQTGKE
jgi:hypothetical protein